MDPIYILFVVMTLSIVLMQMNRRAPSPIRELVIRWIRWGVFATGGAYFMRWFELSDHPYWMLVLIFAALWFLGETLYNWLAIKALSESALPLFPKYVTLESGESWPTQPRFLKMRDEIRDMGFKHVSSASAEIVEGVHTRVSVFEDTGAKVRLQITFLPQTHNAIGVCAGCSSQTVEGHRYITDNIYVPFAGFFPENWFLERHPWTRSLKGLLECHKKRLAKNNEKPVTQTTDPIADINSNQHQLDTLNTELGFLTPHHEREEYGKVTNAGRYRVWKELWTLNYFGRAARYE